MTTKTAEKLSQSRAEILTSILKEIRSLRRDLLFFLLQENLDGYAHPGRIKRSYQKAIRRYPAAGVWK